jgi:hypothetical protein
MASPSKLGVVVSFQARCQPIVSARSGVYLSQPFSTRAFISEYAVSMSLLSAAAFVTVPGLSFTWRLNLPVPCNKQAGSGSAAQ